MLPLILDIGDANKTRCYRVSLTMAEGRLWRYKEIEKAAQVHELTYPIDYKLQTSGAKPANGNSRKQEMISRPGFCSKASTRLTNQLLQIKFFAGTFMALHHNVLC